MTRVLLAGLAAVLLCGPVRADGLPEGERVEIRTSDGLRISGTFWRGTRDFGPAVVLVHGLGADRRVWAPLVPHLLARRLAVVAIDLRGHGASALQGGENLAVRAEARDPLLFAEMHQDVMAAVRWLSAERGRDAARIGLVGASVGASVVLDTARRQPLAARALVGLTPGKAYVGLDSLAHASALAPGISALLVAHREEAAGAEEVAAALRAGRADAEGPATVTLRILEAEKPPQAAAEVGFFHGTNAFGRVPLLESYVAGFLARELGAIPGDALLDGLVGVESEPAGAWALSTGVPSPSGAALSAYRVGTRIVFGGRMPTRTDSVRLLVEARTADGLLAKLSADMVHAPDALVVDGPPAEGFMGSGSFLPADLPWPEPPVSILFVRHASNTSFEGEVPLPADAAGDVEVRMAWACGSSETGAWSYADGVTEGDAGGWRVIEER